MGPSLDGCTHMVYVNEKVFVGNCEKSVCKTRTTFNGVVILKNGKEMKIRIKNYAYALDLTDYLLSITYALQNDFHFMNEDKTMVL